MSSTTSYSPPPPLIMPPKNAKTSSLSKPSGRVGKRKNDLDDLEVPLTGPEDDAVAPERQQPRRTVKKAKMTPSYGPAFPTSRDTDVVPSARVGISPLSQKAAVPPKSAEKCFRGRDIPRDLPLSMVMVGVSDASFDFTPAVVYDLEESSLESCSDHELAIYYRGLLYLEDSPRLFHWGHFEGDKWKSFGSKLSAILQALGGAETPAACFTAVRAYFCHLNQARVLYPTLQPYVSETIAVDHPLVVAEVGPRPECKVLEPEPSFSMVNSDEALDDADNAEQDRQFLEIQRVHNERRALILLEVKNRHRQELRNWSKHRNVIVEHLLLREQTEGVDANGALKLALNKSWRCKPAKASSLSNAAGDPGSQNRMILAPGPSHLLVPVGFTASGSSAESAVSHDVPIIADANDLEADNFLQDAKSAADPDVDGLHNSDEHSAQDCSKSKKKGKGKQLVRDSAKMFIPTPPCLSGVKALTINSRLFDVRYHGREPMNWEPPSLFLPPRIDLGVRGQNPSVSRPEVGSGVVFRGWSIWLRGWRRTGSPCDGCQRWCILPVVAVVPYALLRASPVFGSGPGLTSTCPVSAVYPHAINEDESPFDFEYTSAKSRDFLGYYFLTLPSDGRIFLLNGKLYEHIICHNTWLFTQVLGRNMTDVALGLVVAMRENGVPPPVNDGSYTPPTLLSASPNLSPLQPPSRMWPPLSPCSLMLRIMLAVNFVDHVFPAIAKLVDVFEQTSCQLNSQLALINRNALQRVEGETRDEHYSEDSEGAGQGDEWAGDGTDEDVRMRGVEGSGANNASEMGGCRSSETAPDGGECESRNVPSNITVALDMVAEVVTGASSVPAAPVATPPYMFHSLPSIFKHSSVFFGSQTSPPKTPSGLSHKFLSLWIPSAALASPTTAESGDTSLPGAFGMPEHLALPALPLSRKTSPDDVQVDSRVDGSSTAGAASGQ
ncbi:hypothetical protein B0H17DRAFT_1135713 [Mycena rosella]|uniref:Uncharacterized protein n=1 Tax=Mycena rosella TaxID=1033263 RepID=A0AAD7DE92_MYCRO|nr:hypothetical protein B0H17DRAFT_1135713 [Mycena rosella]